VPFISSRAHLVGVVPTSQIRMHLWPTNFSVAFRRANATHRVLAEGRILVTRLTLAILPITNRGARPANDYIDGALCGEYFTMHDGTVCATRKLAFCCPVLLEQSIRHLYTAYNRFSISPCSLRSLPSSNTVSRRVYFQFRSQLSFLLPLVCHIYFRFGFWTMLNSHLFTIVVKKLINVFSSLSHPASCIFPY